MNCERAFCMMGGILQSPYACAYNTLTAETVRKKRLPEGWLHIHLRKCATALKPLNPVSQLWGNLIGRLPGRQESTIPLPQVGVNVSLDIPAIP